MTRFKLWQHRIFTCEMFMVLHGIISWHEKSSKFSKYLNNYCEDDNVINHATKIAFAILTKETLDGSTNTTETMS